MRMRFLLRTRRSGLPARMEEWPRELKGVLALDADVVAALDPPVSVLVQERGMAGEPVGLVEVGGLAVVREVALCSRHDVDSWCWSWGIATSLSVTVRRPLWANVMSVVGARAVGGCQSGIRGLLAGCGWSHNARYVNPHGRLPFKVCQPVIRSK